MGPLERKQELETGPQLDTEKPPGTAVAVDRGPLDDIVVAAAAPPVGAGHAVELRPPRMMEEAAERLHLALALYIPRTSADELSRTALHPSAVVDLVGNQEGRPLPAVVVVADLVEPQPDWPRQRPLDAWE